MTMCEESVLQKKPGKELLNRWKLVIFKLKDAS